MRKIFFLIFVSLVLSGCKDETNIRFEMFNSIGMGGAPECIFFINPMEGYSFNNKTDRDWSKVTEEQLDDPNYFPKSTDIAEIYKTIDGGKNWKKITSIANRKFFNRALFFENAIYIGTNNFFSNKVFITKFNIFKDTIDFEKEYNVIGSIFTNGKSIYFQTEMGNSVSVFDKDFSNEAKLQWNVGNTSLFVSNNLYTIIRNNKGQNYLQEYINNFPQKISLTLEPECIIRNGDALIIAGNSQKSIISLVSYNLETKQKSTLKEFEGYDIVQGLQSNDKVICGFIGNIKGAFTEYDLFYSLDQGKTWQIQELKEKSHIRPNCLVNNILYIYSGGGKFQRITF